jgi:succinyl-diaminopimelate desuccinylase
MNKCLVSEIESARMEIAEVCSQLVQRPSAHPDGRTVECVSYIKDYFKEQGIETKVHARNKEKPNIVVRLKGESDRTIMWLGHLDVVPEGKPESWKHPAYSGKITDDGYIWGRGTSDMKGACAAAMVAAKLLYQRDDLPHNYDLWFTADEEIGGTDGARWLAEDKIFSGEVCIIGDGTPGTPKNPAIDLGCKGGAGTKLIASGRTAHGSTPYLGDNAIDKLLEVIPHIYKIGEYRLDVPKELEPVIKTTIEYMMSPELTESQKKALRRIFHYPSVTLNIFNGGVKSNVVPDYAEAVFDIRLTPGTSPLNVKARLESLIEEADVEGVVAEIRSSETAGYYESPDTVFARDLSKTVKEVTGKDPIFKLLTGGTDAVSVKRFMGTPCLGFGASIEGQAHAPDERVSIDVLETSCKVYAVFPYIYEP